MKVVPSRPEVRTDPAPLRGPVSPMIEIDRVSQTFRTSGRQAHLALSDISLTIEDGAFVSILGPSGCGKSTLLYIVGGFVIPSEGEARVRGRTITGPGPFSIVPIRPVPATRSNGIFKSSSCDPTRAEVLNSLKPSSGF